MYNLGISIIISSLLEIVTAGSIGHPTALSAKAPKTDIQQNSLQPIFAPDKCPKNQFLYPDTNGTEWTCDCGPGHIYYLPLDGCYLPYRQGPCNNSQYLVIQKGKRASECVENSCSDGSVRYKGSCYELDTEEGPCPPVSKGGGAFGVNYTTMEVGCLTGSEPLSLFKVPSNCPLGSKRDSAGRCRENFNV